MTGLLDVNFVTVLNGLAYGMLIYTLAVGLSLIFGMLNLLNLAHGTFYLLGAYIAAALIPKDGSWVGWLLAIGVGILAGAAGGLLLRLMTRPTVARGHMSEALLTLGLSLAGSSFLLWAFGGEPKSVPPPDGLDGVIDVAGSPYPVYRIIVIGLGLALAVVVEIVIERTSMGATIRAIVHDEPMVRALGINTRRVIFGVLIAGSGLAALTGVIGGPILGASQGLDGQVLLIALVVVVLGGLGFARGALPGAILIGLIQNVGIALSPHLAPFLMFGAMAIVLTLRPQGLLGQGWGRLMSRIGPNTTMFR